MSQIIGQMLGFRDFRFEIYIMMLKMFASVVYTYIFPFAWVGCSNEIFILSLGSCLTDVIIGGELGGPETMIDV